METAVPALPGTIDQVKIYAASRPTNDTTAEAHTWTVETDDYNTGLDEIRAAVPEGFQLLSLQVDRDQ